MLRLIVQITDTGDAANVGGPVHTRYRTFDVDLPDVEELLAKREAWVTRNLVGVELLSAATTKQEEVSSMDADRGGERSDGVGEVQRG